MYDVKKIQDDLFWIGANDRRLALFENIFPIPHGVSYNSYVLLDEKVVVFDSVDRSVSERFFENLDHLLNGRAIDYLVINHIEPDHCGTVMDLITRYPELKIVCTAKAVGLIKQYFDFDQDERFMPVKEGDTLNTGKHDFTFVTAPMVHWPEVMVTYDITTKTLFSADAFGTFNALSGKIFADEYDFERDFLDEARRYYSNIVGKFGAQVQALLKKASKLDIDYICPLHGPVWRENIGWWIEKYIKWSSYQPEETGVVLAYGSIYGNTENTIEILAGKLAEKGMTNIKLMDVSFYHPSYIVGEIFKYSHVVFASPTYNTHIFLNMHTLLQDLKNLNLQNRKVALIENGAWAISSGKQMKEMVTSMKNMELIENIVTIKASMKENQIEELEALAEALVKSE